ncbi:hypothetical protein MAPG_09077, partial [Magnaporthiopsis poae ATCC 64411]
MNAQVSFLDGELSLIHIPLELYSSLLQPILQVLLPQRESLWPGNRARAGRRRHGHGARRRAGPGPQTRLPQRERDA